MKKKIAITIILLIFLSIIIMNSRVPFFQPTAGGWSIGYGFSNQFPKKIDPSKNPIFNIEKLKKIVDSTQFLADPFFIKEKDTFYIFFEHKKINKHPAEIGLLTSVDGIKFNYKGTVLREKFHLSYPQVFKYKGEYFMLPETQGANNVLLYKAVNFPYQWKIADTLIKNIKLKDPTIFLSDTLNVIVGCNNEYQMKLYNANSLNDDWKLNKNPIVTQGSESRPGGRFFSLNNGLILPVQNCTNGYGYGLSLYRFSFSKKEYSIKKITPLFLKKEIKCKEFNAGMHHFDIQKIDNRYFYVYDGNTIIDETKKLNYKRTVKLNFIDFKNWLYK